MKIGRAPSWQSRWINGLLGLLPIKEKTGSAEAVHAYVRHSAQHPAPFEPVGLGRGVTVARRDCELWPVFDTAPLGAGVDRWFVFLHGGGYIKEIVKAHWRFVGGITREAGVRCCVPIYPLAPRGTAAEVVPACGRLLHELMRRVGPERVTVAGNSAGAGLALAACQWLRAEGLPQPDGLVLVSPGVNGALDTPERRALAADDPIQDIPGMLAAARLYAGELPLWHPFVSPLNGALDGLPPMLVFTGTRDLLYPDSIDLAAKVRAAGGTVVLHLREGQPHNYAVLPTPEGRDARAAIVQAAALGVLSLLPAELAVI